MQKFGATYVAVILFFALAAYLMFFRTAAPDAEPDLGFNDDAVVVYEASKADIAGFSVEPDGLTLYIDEDGVWQADTGFSVRLDESRLTMLGTMISPLYANRVVIDDPSDLSVYGLDKPWLRLVVHLKDGTDIIVEFGDQAPVGGAWYARAVGDTRVVTVPVHRVAGLQWSIDDLRSVWVTEFEPADVEEFVVYQGDRTIARFRRLDIDTWQMTRPWMSPVDRGEVEDYLRLFRFLRSEECVSDTPDPSQLAEWGLEKPEYTFTATLYDGTTISVYIGATDEVGEDEDGEEFLYVSLYAMNDHEPSVHLIQPLRDFEEPLNVFLTQRLVPFWRNDIKKVTVVTGQAYWSDFGPTNLISEREREWSITNPNFGRERDLLTAFISIHASGYAGIGKVPALTPGSGPYPAVEFTYQVENEPEVRKLTFVQVDDIYYVQPPGYTVGIWSSADEIDRVLSIVFGD